MRVNLFGHLGDGNVHYNLSPPAGRRDISGLDSEFAIKLGALITVMGGNFAAEHGTGRTKTVLVDTLCEPMEGILMARLKNSYDDTNQLNPDVLVFS